MSAQITLRELEELSRGRALTEAESAELHRAYAAEDLRQRRLPERIIRLRAELHAAEADLWPRYLTKLQALETIEEERRITRLERELGKDQMRG